MLTKHKTPTQGKDFSGTQLLSSQAHTTRLLSAAFTRMCLSTTDLNSKTIRNKETKTNTFLELGAVAHLSIMKTSLPKYLDNSQDL